MDNKYQSKYRIETSRARWHDYNGGYYFITICTDHRYHYLGTIISLPINASCVENSMKLSPIGHYLFSNIEAISSRYPYVEIPQFIIMPNHVHMIVKIDNPEDINLCHNTLLGAVVRAIKSSTTKYANHHSIQFGWQSRYHDHIIRNYVELNRISIYIENNVDTWANDRFNPQSHSK